ncbi:uncharacterized protein [Asterias amurensis]|uniref:uncharacterized protein n=1 Tax=Asterias amurensis TaxID=7602 RepID=UPI003AB74ED6
MMNFIHTITSIFMIIVISVPVCDQLNCFEGMHEMATQTVLEGDPVSLECLDTSVHQAHTCISLNTVKWTYNNEVQSGVYKFNDSSGVLNLKAVNARDSGSYICEVEFLNSSNNRYFTGWKRFRLVVQVPVKEVMIQSTAGCLTAGGAYNFTAEVPNINPPASIDWTLGNKSLRGHETSKLYTSGLYTTFSTVQLRVTSENRNQVLSVHASNVRGRTGKSTSVTLHIDSVNKAVSYGMNWTQLLLLMLVSFLLMR